MRRKSERAKEKDKPSPGKRSEKATRRSRRQARKKRSVSNSPQRNESGPEENETLKGSQEDTEEEQVICVEETSCQVGAVITPDLASTSKVQEVSQSVAVKSRRLKHISESVSANEEKTTETKKCEVHDSDWTEDKTFWEDKDSKPESSEHKHKEKEGRSSVWKVKSTDGGGNEIKKLKLCIVHQTEPSLRKKRRLRRSSGGQPRDIDDNESGKGSQEDEKLSSDEKGNAPKPLSDPIVSGDGTKEMEKETECLVDATRSEAVEHVEGQTETGALDLDAVKENAESCIEKENYASHGVCPGSDASREQTVQENDATLPGETTEFLQHVDESGGVTGVVEEKEEKIREQSEVEESVPVDKQLTDVEKDQKPESGSGGDVSPRSNSSEKNIQDVGIPCSRGEEESDIAADHTECSEKDVSEAKEKDVSEAKEKDASVTEGNHTSEAKEKDASEVKEENTSDVKEEDTSEVKEEDTSDVKEEDTSVVKEEDTSEVKEEDTSEVKEEDTSEDKEKDASEAKEKDASEIMKKYSKDTDEDPEKNMHEDPSILSLTADEIVVDDIHPRIEALDIMSDSVESKSRDDLLELKNVSSSPDEQGNSNNDGDVLKLQPGSSDDEKEDMKHRKSRSRKRNLPHSRERRHESRSLRERKNKSQGRSKDRDLEKSRSSAKHRRHTTRRSGSPRRREKISLKRSFSRRQKESDQNDGAEYSDTTEKMSYQDYSNEENVERNKNELDSIGDNSGTPRRRRWGQRNTTRPSKRHALAISTDSLKTLIPGAKPVPAGEVQLIPEEDVRKEYDLSESEKESEIEKHKSDVVEEVPEKLAPILPEVPRINVAVTDDQQSKIFTRKISIVTDDARTLQKSPSPPRNKVSNILFITNLVRPFTVPQIKELLARTGKIMEGGFWIDRIKSKCYVEYETEIEAKETRHALHGVRWPVSNPKTLCVDYGKKEDVELAQAAAESDPIPHKTEPPRVQQNVEAWVADQTREKNREREIKERGREIEREKERPRGKDRIHSGPVEVEHNKKQVAVREWDLGKIGQTSPNGREARYDEKREKDRKFRKEKGHRSRSVSPHEPPVKKVKKKDDDAPAKLLDDLFRKTKATPCIYWLPLAAEQIVVKEEIRRKHMAEHERRMAEMRKAERERERVRAQQRQRKASEREKRRRRSGSGSPKK